MNYADKEIFDELCLRAKLGGLLLLQPPKRNHSKNKKMHANLFTITPSLLKYLWGSAQS